MSSLYSRAVLLITLALLPACAEKAAGPVARDGVIDLRGWDPGRGPVRLDGEWRWYHGALLGPGEEAEPTGLFQVPGVWNGRAVRGQVLGGDGHGTFRLRLRLPRPGPYGLLLRLTSCAYRLWLDGDLLAQGGVVGDSAERTTPASLTRAVFFEARQAEATLTLQIASYHHARGGPRASLVLGAEADVHRLRERQLILFALLLGALGILVPYQAALFLLRTRERAPLYLAIFCLLIGLMLTMHGPLLFSLFFPGVPYRVAITLEYLALYLAPGAAVLFAHALYPLDSPAWLRRLTLGLFLLLALLVLVTPPRIFTRTLPVFAAVASLTSAAYLVVVQRIVRRRRPESLLLLLGLAMLTIAVASDSARAIWQPLYVSTLTPMGLLGLSFMVAIMIARRSARAHATIERQAEQLSRQSAASYRFVPEAFLRLLGKADITAVRLGDRAQREMAVLFADVRDFTSMSERMSLADNFAFVNTLLGALGPVIREHGGFIDKYLGDGIMALFPEGAADAVRAAVAIRRAVGRINDDRRARSLPLIGIGIGVHAGTLMLGMVGEPERMDGTVIADAVNTAARLEGLTKRYGVAALLSERVAEALPGGGHRLRALGLVRPKGKQEPVRIYELFEGDSDDRARKKERTRPDFEAALVAYQQGRFDEARARFQAVQQADPGDGAAAYYLAQLGRLASAGPPETWDGVEVLTEK